MGSKPEAAPLNAAEAQTLAEPIRSMCLNSRDGEP
jgi:hypothetical protein